MGIHIEWRFAKKELEMRREGKRLALVALAVSAAAFVVVGGPAVAKDLITGSDLAPQTIGSRELANGSISGKKLTKKFRGELVKTGAEGPRGATGPAGPQGAAGATGPAGQFNFVDAAGRVVGPAAGFYSGVYPMVLLPNGLIILYDNDPTTTAAVSLLTTLYYQDATCSGAPFASGLGLPIQSAVIPESSPTPGSVMYQMFGSVVKFKAASQKTNGGCAPSTTNISGFAVKPAGTVPAVTKPLSMVAG